VIQVAGAPGGVKAKGAVLADAATGQILWGRDLGTERPMASVTKVMTALLVLQGGNLGQQIRVPKARSTTPGSTAAKPRRCARGTSSRRSSCWRRCCCRRERTRRIPWRTPTVPG
jgi:D-alanyl-D-alanine carboxypeptidase